MDREISFFVAGIPQPGGSKRGFFNHKTGRVIITEDAKRNKDWRAAVSQVAATICSEILQGPLKVRFEFQFLRPKGHFRSGKHADCIKSSAPPYPAARPDVTKLIRSTEDALTGVVWKDDSQIVTQMATKRYSTQAGCVITIRAEM